MFNWTVGFVSNIKDIMINAAFIFAFGNLIVSTALDIAFHGILKIRLAGASPSDGSRPMLPSDVPPSFTIEEAESLFNNF